MSAKRCRFCGHSWASKRFLCPSCGESLTAVYLPTKEEIEEGVLRIQEKWSPQEEGRRQASVEPVGVTRVKLHRSSRGSRDSSDC